MPKNLKNLYIGAYIRAYMRANIGSKRRHRETYWQRWVKQHPRISIYLNREDYDVLKKVSDSLGLSYREVLLNAVSDIKALHDKLSKALEMIIEGKAHQQGYDEGYRKGYEAGYEQALKDIRNAKVPEYKIRALGLEYIKCAICKKPLEGYVVKTGTKLTEAIKNYVIRTNIHHSYHDKVVKND